MTKRGDEPAFPCSVEALKARIVHGPECQLGPADTVGMTTRTWLAGILLAGWRAGGALVEGNTYAQRATKDADALLAELEK